jgi:RNA polymerase sigma factor (sigma-70 family)
MRKAALVEEASADLLTRWRAGDQDAAGVLFHRYAERLAALARSRVPRQLGHRIDPEDVVHSAYRSFFAAARDGRYEPSRGGDLWQLLVTITLRKLYCQVERLSADKRAASREQSFGSEDSLLGLQPRARAADASPVEAVALVDEVEKVMRSLEPRQRQVFELRLQGQDCAEIAAAMACTERTVRRILEQIKRQLEQVQGRE